MNRWIAVALATGLGVFALAGSGIADKRTVTDAEGDTNSAPPHQDFVSGTQAHAGKRGLVHTATVAGKADESDYPQLYLNTKGHRRQSAPEYLAQVTEGGPVVTKLETGENKPLLVSIGEDELVNTYRFAFTKGAIGKPRDRYGWQFAYPDDDTMPSDNFAIHNLG